MSEQVNGQAEASVESRVEAALFGQAPKPRKAPVYEAPPEIEPPESEAPGVESTEAETEGESPEETFEFEAEGEKFILPKKLEKAVAQQKDYTQKTMDLAEQRKSFELLHEQARIQNLRAEFETESATELQQLQAYDAVLNQKVNWETLGEADVGRTLAQRQQWKDEREAIARTLQGKHQQFMQKMETSSKELKAKALETLSKRIPGWNDATQKAIRDHAIADGYTEAELNQIFDPRHTLTLWKASQFDQLKSKATKAVTDVRTIKSTASNPMPQHVKDKLSFNRAIKGTAPGSSERKMAVESRVASMFEKR